MSKISSNQFAKAGISILKRLVFDESTLAPENRRGEPRDQVAGEVEVLVLNEQGETVGQSRVFIRDMSKGGCGLWARTAIPAGCSVIVKFPGTNGNPPVGKMARVQHCRGQAGTGFAIGIRFTESSKRE
jgi:hypothetical protein